MLFVLDAPFVVECEKWLVGLTGSDATTGDGILLLPVGNHDAHVPALGIHASKMEAKASVTWCR